MAQYPDKLKVESTPWGVTFRLLFSKCVSDLHTNRIGPTSGSNSGTGVVVK
jgi:hypothetical protein